MNIEKQIQELESDRLEVSKNKFCTPEILAVYDRRITTLKSQINSTSTAEKKSPSESVEQPEAKNATSAESSASSSQSRNSEDFADSVVLESGSSSGDNLGDKKWVGLAHHSKFKNTEGYNLYKSAYNKLRHKLRGWVRGLKKKSKAEKLRDSIDHANEIQRIVKNEAKPHFKEELLSLEYSITVKGKSYAFGISEKALNSFFNAE